MKMSVEYLFTRVSRHIAKGGQVKGAVRGLQSFKNNTFPRYLMDGALKNKYKCVMLGSFGSS